MVVASFEDALREAINRSGKTCTRLSRMAGVCAPTVLNFASGKQKTLTLTTAQALCKVLGLDLVPVKI
jgi:hypothetical protein